MQSIDLEKIQGRGHNPKSSHVSSTRALPRPRLFSTREVDEDRRGCAENQPFREFALRPWSKGLHCEAICGAAYANFPAQGEFWRTLKTFLHDVLFQMFRDHKVTWLGGKLDCKSILINVPDGPLHIRVERCWDMGLQVSFIHGYICDTRHVDTSTWELLKHCWRRHVWKMKYNYDDHLRRCFLFLPLVCSLVLCTSNLRPTCPCKEIFELWGSSSCLGDMKEWGHCEIEFITHLWILVVNNFFLLWILDSCKTLFDELIFSWSHDIRDISEFPW